MRESAKYLGVVLFEKQLKAMKAFMEDKDTFVTLPTGYAILPFAFDKQKVNVFCHKVSSCDAVHTFCRL